MMKRCLIVLLFIIFLLKIVVVQAQQEAQFSHNMFTNMAINPGYAGSKDAICLTGIVHQQWVGFKDPSGNKGAPQTYLLTIDGAVNRISSGFGLNIYQDKLGFETNLAVKLSYAFRVSIGPGKLGIGAQAGFINKQIDFDKFIPIDAGDPLLNSKKIESDMLIDFAAGLYYKMPQAYFGLSASNLSQSDFQSASELAKPSLSRHYYFIAGYHYDLNAEFKLSPSLLIKSDMASTQYDINSLVTYNNRFWGGLSYRPQDAIIVLLGLNWQNFNFGYAYDITTSAIGAGSRSSGSHEVMLNYCFKIEIPHTPSRHKTVRFL
ncbi:MAG: type IX secretion system membrane protein PorP/SprF [Saprospiraceae bacterium]|nr:type IX secretion system membrane protein PorP/SprF [Saprospiraceae bacterium]